EGLIGFFVNTLVLRADLSGGPSFRQLLGRVRGTALDAYAHQDLPFERLVEELPPDRAANRQPLVQVMIQMVHVAFPPLEGGGRPVEGAGLGVEGQEVESEAARLDLALALMRGRDGVDGFWDYRTDLFEEETIRRMQRHYERLLESAVADPDAPVGRLELLTE